jgi:ribA/ribD-fused uncharacterized protein
MYPSSSDGLNKETDTGVYFFTPAFYPLDNYSAHTVMLWGHTFLTAEHAYQWKKFSVASPDIAEKIHSAPSPEAVKRISDSYKPDPEGWSEHRVSVMKEILEAKAAQHEDVRELLQKTGTRMIAENSPIDSFWGLGPEGNGENTVGKIWMEIRKRQFSQ